MTQLSDPRQAGAQNEIFREMIDAGVIALEDNEESSTETQAIEVFRAMIDAQRQVRQMHHP
jgi:hypothetical protein